MRLFSRYILFISFLYTFFVLGYIIISSQPPAKADTNHIVISQIQLSGTAGANDEFVELYNPTDISIDITGWRLNKKTSASGATPQNLVASFTGAIAPHAYYLVAHPSSSFTEIADKLYSSSSSAMTSNNTISLFSDAGSTVIDKVGIGTASDGETTAFPTNPLNNQSILRKASVNSTELSLILGGSENNYGNGFDTDNNANDFVLITNSQPRNSLHIPALATPTITSIPTVLPTNTPTPTTMPTPIPTNTPIPTMTPTPSSVPTNTPMPTLQPTSTPIPTNTPMPSVMPSIQPTATPIPSIMPTSIPTPRLTPTPSITIIMDQKLSMKRRLVCTQALHEIQIVGMHIKIPVIHCEIIRI